MHPENGAEAAMRAISLKKTLDAVGLPWATVLLIAVASTLIYTGPALWQTWTHHGPTLVTDGDGFVAGHDFVAFYSASQAVQGGNARQVYDATFMKARQHALVGDDTVGYLPFMYPPTFLLLVAPLSALPYFPALALWLALPLGALLLTIGRSVEVPPAALFMVIAAPAAGQAAFAGQNGFLFAALLSAGLLLHERQPVLAGILLGFATAKPQLAALVFPALAFGRHWRALAAAAAMVIVMVLISAAAFGPEIWLTYIKVPGLAREWLAAGRLPWPRMPTVYAALRLAGLGDLPASIVQILAALLVTASVAWIWWCKGPVRLRIAALLAAAPLATPFMYDYDLPFMLTALALFVAEAASTGWRPWEKPLTLAVWLQPVWWWTLSATVWGISIAPLIYGLFFLAIMRRTGAFRRNRIGSQTARSTAVF